jgi:F0F1-type ATP synthase membrane subunit a
MKLSGKVAVALYLLTWAAVLFYPVSALWIILALAAAVFFGVIFEGLGPRGAKHATPSTPSSEERP